MKVKIAKLWRDQRGTSALEFALTAPAFFLIIFGIFGSGLLFWTQIGLQHGVEMAARCATINTTLCGDATAISTYATQQALGLAVPPSTFTFNTVSCGNQVSASYPFQLPALLGISSLTLTAQACFPVPPPPPPT